MQPALAARHQHATLPGIADRIGDQVAQHQFDQRGIAVQRGGGIARAVHQPARIGLRREFVLELVQQRLQPEGPRPGRDHAGFQLGEVQQRVQHLARRAG
ncbi:hypothetical protein D3C72_1993080 [compost metagenome]